MRIIATGCFLIVISSNCVCRGADKAETPEAAVQKWAKAFESGSAATMLNRYAESEDLIVIVSAGLQRTGYKAMKKEYEKAFREVKFSKSGVTVVKAKQDGDFAWVSCRHRVELLITADKSRWQLEVRTSFTLKKHKQGWRIVMEHSSPIANVPRYKKI